MWIGEILQYFYIKSKGKGGDHVDRRLRLDGYSLACTKPPSARFDAEEFAVLEHEIQYT